MMNNKGAISLKIKLLLILIGISISILTVYASMALDEFENDKMAYVFDATKTHSKNISSQVKSEIETAVDKIQFYMRGYNYSSTGGFHPYSKSNFQSDHKLQSIVTFTQNPESLNFSQHSTMNKQKTSTKLPSEAENELIKEATQHKLSIRLSPTNSQNWLLALLFEVPGSDKSFIVISEVTKGQFLESFTDSQLQDSFVINNSGKIILSPLNSTYTEFDNQQLEPAFADSLTQLSSPVSIFEKTIGKSNLLISISKIGVGDLYIASFLPKEKALEAVKRLMVKSIIFLLLLISITIFISVLASNKLTSALKKLLTATEKVASGDFDVQLNIKTKDEVESLANGFNQMAQEIKRLLDETAEKARMEGELQTAQLVQSTLFPPNTFEDHDIAIEGYYKSASECGGDWWFYNNIGSKVILWIGDATGHGVPAALVTSAANSAANVMTQLANLTPDKMMSQMNQAIYNTAKGKVLMTFFIGVFDKDTQMLSYCCASHDPPFLLPQTGTPLKRKNIVPLMDNAGPRLGESLESQYESSEVQLHPGDRIVFYTDGVTELHNEQSELLGERKFIKSLLDSFNENEDINTSMSHLFGELEKFKGGAVLEDDVTYFMFEYKNQQLLENVGSM